jgi:hypothetical protein
MPKPLDPMWKYGEPYEGHNRLRLNCKLCGMEMFSRISHLKYHLAKIPRHEVDIFPASTPEIVHIANQSILDIARKRDQREEMRLELANKTTRSMGTTSFSGEGETHSSTTPSTVPSASSPFFVLRSMPRGQPPIQSIIKTREEEEANKIVAICFL